MHKLVTVWLNLFIYQVNKELGLIAIKLMTHAYFLIVQLLVDMMSN
jgi:hypothetical protein